MDKTERLLDLTALFLDSQNPISFEELQKVFPSEYGTGSKESALRKFERDKAELLEAGLPLEYESRAAGHTPGYVIRRDEYYLKDPGLRADEMALLYSAGSAALASGAFPAADELKRALQKIAFFGDEIPRTKLQLDIARSPMTKHTLSDLWAAIARRKTVDMKYHSPHAAKVSSRRINPLGLAMRRGQWNLVGYCHLRKALRTFLVHRIQSYEVNTLNAKQPDFEVPTDFNVTAHVAHFPWEFKMHEPVQITLLLSEELIPLSKQLLGAESADAELEMTVTDLDSLLKFCLSMTGRIQVHAPVSAVRRMTQMKKAIAKAHGVKS
jgi:proteasome accessory factor B